MVNLRKNVFNQNVQERERQVRLFFKSKAKRRVKRVEGDV